MDSNPDLRPGTSFFHCVVKLSMAGVLEVLRCLADSLAGFGLDIATLLACRIWRVGGLNFWLPLITQVLAAKKGLIQEHIDLLSSYMVQSLGH